MRVLRLLLPLKKADHVRRLRQLLQVSHAVNGVKLSDSVISGGHLVKMLKPLTFTHAL